MSFWSTIKATFSRGSRADKLIRAIPNPSTILRRLDTWAEVLKDWGDAGLAWEPQDSRLLAVVKDTADALDVAGGFIGAGGSDKLSAITEQVRIAIATIGFADDAFDAFWEKKGRAILEDYLVRSRALKAVEVFRK